MEYHDLITLAKQSTRVGVLDNADAKGSATNASCGDLCTMSVRIADGKIVEMRYEAKGCVISRAAAAMLAAQSSQSIADIRTMNGDTIRTLLGAPISPLRERCLTTALAALQNAVNSYEA